MDLKQAFAAMKTGKPVKFWFCAKDDKGQPRILCHPMAVPQKDIQEVLKTAKSKTTSTGIMRMASPGSLTVVVKGKPPSGLKKDLQVALRNARLTTKLEVQTAELVEQQALGERYKDENKKQGWRADYMVSRKPGESVEAFEKRLKEKREGTAVTTHYFNEAAKAASEVTFAQGVAKMSGKALGAGSIGYVLDPETGKAHGFEENTSFKDARKKTKVNHHSSPLAGKPVAGAGVIVTDDTGRVTAISDKSGHYKPGAELTHQAVKHLDQQGALETPEAEGRREAKVHLVDKNAGVTDEQWHVVKGKHEAIQRRVKLNQLKGPLGERAYANLLRKQPAKLKEMVKKYKTVEALKAALAVIAMKELEAEVERDEGRLDAVAAELFAKIPGADLTLKDLDSQAAVNIKAGEAGASVTTKSQFLQSEGNEAQIRNKTRLIEEMRVAEEKKQKKKQEEEKKKQAGDAPKVEPESTISSSYTAGPITSDDPVPPQRSTSSKQKKTSKQSYVAYEEKDK